MNEAPKGKREDEGKIMGYGREDGRKKMRKGGSKEGKNEDKRP